MNQSFYNALGTVIPTEEIASKSGLSYLNAGAAIRLAGMPIVEFVDFGGMPHLELLNGALVAVDIHVPGTDAKQRMWLPVMDQDNKTLDIGTMTLTDVNNNRQRCLVKNIAAVFGSGMSLYLGCDGDGAKAVKLLGVEPDSDLSAVPPVVATLNEGGAPYIEWGVAVAACRITDPNFHWSVVDWNGLPYREVMGGVLVDVETVYKGRTQRLSLPVMDAAHNPIPVAKASVFDWNKAVMRALTKCIAFNSGYGLGVYADDFGSVAGAKPSAKDARKKSTAKADAPAADTPAAETPKVDAAPEAAPAAVQAEAAAPAEEAKAPEAAPAQADAKEEAKPDAAAEQAAAPSNAAASTDAGECVTRFKSVLQKRRTADGTVGVIRLFGDLNKSTKFTEAEKPVCFGVLVPAAAAFVTAAEIGMLLAEIQTYNAMTYVAQDNLDVVAGRLTAVALAAGLAVSDEELLKSVGTLVQSGVAATQGDVLRLAQVGGVPSETIDLLVAAIEA